MISAASGNTTVGGAGIGSSAALAAAVHASGNMAAAYLGRHAAAPSVVEPVAYAAAFDLAHTLSDGSTFSFVHANP